MTVALVLFTSDLRLHDHPPLRAALSAADEVVPLFVRDPAIGAAGFDAANRRAFLADCLADLDAGLRERGGRLTVRSGDVVRRVCETAARAGAGEVHMAAGVSGYARRREARLRTALEADGRRLRVHDGVITAVPPGEIAPAGSDHYAVFTPYFRRWLTIRPRTPVGAPRRLSTPDGLPSEPLPRRSEVSDVSPGLAVGGEREARRRLAAWRRGPLARYHERQDDLAADATSRLSAHLHFGTLSPVEVLHRCGTAGGPGAEAFVRQLAWRDFHHQVLAARPDASWSDYRTHHDHWRTRDRAAGDIARWQEGRTGYPVVDAAMRQLRHEGWMPNRGRLITSFFLTTYLYVDWRIGARHFLDLLVDGDIANNQMNWQWAAGTGTDTRPNRVLNPVRQSHRFDPDGTYVRRWVPELRALDGRDVHEPWRLSGPQRTACDYPEPVPAPSEGAARFRRARGIG